MQTKDKQSAGKKNSAEKPASIVDVLCAAILCEGLDEKKVLKELSKVDLQIKTTKVEPWLLIESFLLRLFSLS